MVYSKSKVSHGIPVVDYITVEAAEHGNPQQLYSGRLGSNPMVQIPHRCTRAAAHQDPSERHRAAHECSVPGWTCIGRPGKSRYRNTPLKVHRSAPPRPSRASTPPHVGAAEDVAAATHM
jgi:hypothetical protein